MRRGDLDVGTAHSRQLLRLLAHQRQPVGEQLERISVGVAGARRGPRQEQHQRARQGHLDRSPRPRPRVRVLLDGHHALAAEPVRHRHRDREHALRGAALVVERHRDVIARCACGSGLNPATASSGWSINVCRRDHLVDGAVLDLLVARRRHLTGLEPSASPDEVVRAQQRANGVGAINGRHLLTFPFSRYGTAIPSARHACCPSRHPRHPPPASRPLHPAGRARPQRP